MSATLPGPTPLPLLGNLTGLARDPLAFLTANARAHGDRVAWSVPGKPVVQLTSPEDIELVLVRTKDTIKDPVTRDLRFVLGDGLLTSEGEPWRAHRKMVAPSFQPRHLAAYGEAMVRSATESPPQAGRTDVHHWMSRVTLDIVMRTLFGSEPGGEAAEVGPLIEGISRDFDTEIHGLGAAMPRWMPLPHRRRLASAASELDGLLRRLIRARAAGRSGDDLLWRLLEARNEDGVGLTESELRDEAITLFLAGHETTALALSYTLWLLASHPEVQERVHAELVGVLGDRPATAADTRSLPLTKAVLDEGMRLYPPAWTIGRELTTPLKLGDVEIAAGTEVLMPQWVVHRDPRWFRDAEAFRPDRWLNGETAGLPRFAYYPFGGGPRVCVGNHFAVMEAILVLATVLRSHTFAALPGWKPELLPAITLRSRNGVWMDVSPLAALPPPRVTLRAGRSGDDLHQAT